METFAALRETFGFDSFRPLQQEIVEAILRGQDVFALMPTGGGKSLCYQLPALLRPGVTVVVSPLIALMKDQVDKLQAMGVAASYVNSSLTPAEVSARQAAIARGAVKLLYVAPERLMMQGFMQLLSSVQLEAIAIDEAHCISEWGHDFRPEYRELARLRDRFPSTPIAAFTATATRRVQGDIVEQLRLRDAVRFRGSFDRANLFYDVRPKRDAYRQLRSYLNGVRGQSGIVYCTARATTESVAARLWADGFRAAPYHAGLEPEERRSTQEAFTRDDIEIVVATIAFGMGIDKPDVRFVVHFDLPKNLEGYYQESGRAGRDGEPSDCILFYGYGDAAKHEYFIGQRSSARERDIARAQLRQMMNWAEGRECRRRGLLRYFDEEIEPTHERCCDICVGHTELVDVTEAAHMFLTCIQQLREGFGLAYVIRVLRGSRDERILRARHDCLPLYGAGRSRSSGEWRAIGEELIRAGYVRMATEDFNVLRLTDRGRTALTQSEQVLLPLEREPAVERAERVEGPGDGLFELLRALRKRLADERGLPPYTVFHDATLRQMAVQRPESLQQLRRIPGVGEWKSANFGDAFLRVIVDHAGTAPIQVPAPQPAASLRPPGRQLQSPETLRTTVALFREGNGPAAIAAKRGLTLRTVHEQLARAIEAGEQVDLNRLVSAERQHVIEAAIARIGPDLLKPIREQLGDDFSYDEIRHVRAAWIRDHRSG